MEISLLTGVHLMITIFDKDEGKIIQYLSDSIEKFEAISLIDKISIRSKLCDLNGTDGLKPTKYFEVKGPYNKNKKKF